MKKKTVFFQRLMCLIVFSTFGIMSNVMAGEIRTQDKPKEEGGYYNGHYHLKSQKDKKPFVKRDQHMHNPFHGFTNYKGSKPKKQGEMPTSK